MAKRSIIAEEPTENLETFTENYENISCNLFEIKSEWSYIVRDDSAENSYLVHVEEIAKQSEPKIIISNCKKDYLEIAYENENNEHISINVYNLRSEKKKKSITTFNLSEIPSSEKRVKLIISAFSVIEQDEDQENSESQFCVKGKKNKSTSINLDGSVQLMIVNEYAKSYHKNKKGRRASASKSDETIEGPERSLMSDINPGRLRHFCYRWYKRDIEYIINNEPETKLVSYESSSSQPEEVEYTAQPNHIKCFHTIYCKDGLELKNDRIVILGTTLVQGIFDYADYSPIDDTDYILKHLLNSQSSPTKIELVGSKNKIKPYQYKILNRDDELQIFLRLFKTDETVIEPIEENEKSFVICIQNLRHTSILTQFEFTTDELIPLWKEQVLVEDNSMSDEEMPENLIDISDSQIDGLSSISSNSDSTTPHHEDLIHRIIDVVGDKVSHVLDRINKLETSLKRKHKDVSYEENEDEGDEENHETELFNPKKKVKSNDCLDGEFECFLQFVRQFKCCDHKAERGNSFSMTGRDLFFNAPHMTNDKYMLKLLQAVASIFIECKTCSRKLINVNQLCSHIVTDYFDNISHGGNSNDGNQSLSNLLTDRMKENSLAPFSCDPKKNEFYSPLIMDLYSIYNPLMIDLSAQWFYFLLKELMEMEDKQLNSFPYLSDSMLGVFKKDSSFTTSNKLKTLEKDILKQGNSKLGIFLFAEYEKIRDDIRKSLCEKHLKRAEELDSVEGRIYLAYYYVKLSEFDKAYELIAALICDGELTEKSSLYLLIGANENNLSEEQHDEYSNQFLECFSNGDTILFNEMARLLVHWKKFKHLTKLYLMKMEKCASNPFGENLVEYLHELWYYLFQQCENEQVPDLNSQELSKIHHWTVKYSILINEKFKTFGDCLLVYRKLNTDMYFDILSIFNKFKYFRELEILESVGLLSASQKQDRMNILSIESSNTSPKIDSEISIELEYIRKFVNNQTVENYPYGCKKFKLMVENQEAQEYSDSLYMIEYENPVEIIHLVKSKLESKIIPFNLYDLICLLVLKLSRYILADMFLYTKSNINSKNDIVQYSGHLLTILYLLTAPEFRQSTDEFALHNSNLFKNCVLTGIYVLSLAKLRFPNSITEGIDDMMNTIYSSFFNDDFVKSLKQTKPLTTRRCSISTAVDNNRNNMDFDLPFRDTALYEMFYDLDKLKLLKNKDFLVKTKKWLKLISDFSSLKQGIKLTESIYHYLESVAMGKEAETLTEEVKKELTQLAAHQSPEIASISLHAQISGTISQTADNQKLLTLLNSLLFERVKK